MSIIFCVYRSESLLFDLLLGMLELMLSNRNRPAMTQVLRWQTHFKVYLLIATSNLCSMLKPDLMILFYCFSVEREWLGLCGAGAISR